MLDRRKFMGTASLGLGAMALPSCVSLPQVRRASGRNLPAFFEDLERRTFSFFWEVTDHQTGLVPDRWPTPSFSSIAAIGFGLTAYIIGAERGWISREQAEERTLNTLRYLIGLPSGDAAEGVSGYKGFFYHFLDSRTGHRFGKCELSTVDTGLLHLGALHAAAWYDSDSSVDREIRQLAYALVDQADWTWFQRDGLGISMGWHPESGFIDRNWDGYNEGKFVYILALGSGGYPVPDGSWSAWTAPYPRFWRGEGATRRLAFAPMFGHQYSEMWIDFRGIFDPPMREAGFDYFENSRRETLAQHAYARTNPMGWSGYDERIWGLTACDGPGNIDQLRHGRAVTYRGYSARGPIDEPDGFDDGTLAPTAVLGSLPFAPEICIPSAMTMHERYGSHIYRRYGFLDSFNPSLLDTDAAVETGTVDPELGWVAADWLGIDQGPILGMLANYRSETIWRTMRRSPNIVRGLQRAGFASGWLDELG